MNPIYLDLHIHTSENPEALNESYDSNTLLSKISETAQELDFLISLTDHNTINERVYLDVLEKIKTDYPNSALILGVELHIRKYREDKNAKAYHCHIFFDIEEITSDIIQNINSKLDILYSNKIPANKDNNIPPIEDILDTFNEYDFLLLPHGGQTHSTFDDTVRSASESQDFDNTLYRSLYYNFFDGFTSRSNDGIKKTLDYFRKIGIDQFVGLVTASDNYQPNIYPNTKSKEASKFVPTWMFATSTFDGLRVALSDSTRLTYSQNKPKQWENTITHIQLNNEKIDIDINFTAGLNVIIGGSSSGKTLLVDSINRKLNNKQFDRVNDETSVYNDDYCVEEINVLSPTKIKPYYISQNYISGVINSHGKIKEIKPLDRLFPNNSKEEKQMSTILIKLGGEIKELFRIVEQIEKCEENFQKISIFSKLIVTDVISQNTLDNLLNTSEQITNVIDYPEETFSEDSGKLKEIRERLKKHPIITCDVKIYNKLLLEIETAVEYSKLHNKIFKAIKKYKQIIDSVLEKEYGEMQRRRNDFERLVKNMKECYNLFIRFDTLKNKIVDYNKVVPTEEVNINGHRLSVRNKILINKYVIKESLNKYLKQETEIKCDLEQIMPQNLYRKNFKKGEKGSPKQAVPEYTKIAENTYSEISEQYDTEYSIMTKDGNNFTKLSPGKQTAVILDLILSYDGDNAPIIIDQPEDNLSSEYMNTDLVELIKQVKTKKQIIFVSHNATIPMIGDAQNIILCQNNNGEIKIRSAPLEGKIYERKAVDYVAEITDGGKQSVKKRFKKYNLKRFKN